MLLPSSPFLFVPYLLIFIYFHGDFSVATDTIYPNQSISDGQTLTSSGGTFKLGFFGPNNSSSNRYLAIWYNLDSPEQATLWVANREDPLTDTTGVLGFDEVTSNLVLTDATNRTLWSSNITAASTLDEKNVVAKLLDYGNLVLLQNEGSKMWSSFDQVTDTFVPQSQLTFGVKSKNNTLGVKIKNNTLVNWKSKFDPSPGNFAVGLSFGEFFQGFVYVNGSIPYWRMGPWMGHRFIGVPDMDISSSLRGLNLYTPDGNEVIFSCNLPNVMDSSSILLRLVLDSEGQLINWHWNKTGKRWIDAWRKPENKCDLYGTCGEFATCNPYVVPICSCIEGFAPRSSEDWGKGNFSGGCERIKELSCKRNESGDVYIKIEGLKLPDFPSYASLKDETECEKLCSKNCNCLAYAYLYKICLTWDFRLLDMRTFPKGGEMLNVKLHVSALDHATDNGMKKKLIISLVSVLGTILFCCGLLLSLRIRKQKGNMTLVNL